LPIGADLRQLARPLSGSFFFCGFRWRIPPDPAQNAETDATRNHRGEQDGGQNSRVPAENLMAKV